MKGCLIFLFILMQLCFCVAIELDIQKVENKIDNLNEIINDNKRDTIYCNLDSLKWENGWD